LWHAQETNASKTICSHAEQRVDGMKRRLGTERDGFKRQVPTMQKAMVRTHIHDEPANNEKPGDNTNLVLQNVDGSQDTDTPEVGAFYNCIDSSDHVKAPRTPCINRPGQQTECLCKRFARAADHQYLTTPSANDTEEATCCHMEDIPGSNAGSKQCIPTCAAPGSE